MKLAVDAVAEDEVEIPGNHDHGKTLNQQEAFVRQTAMLIIACLLLLSTSYLLGDVKTETVTYKSGDEIVSGYLVTPGTAGSHPALIVVHEYFGLVDWSKEQAQKFAAQGYVVLAVDLFRGKTTTDPDAAHEFSMGLPRDRAIRDLEAGFQYLASRPDVNKEKIGSVGWCMGGGYSLQLAVHEPRLAASVVNYGSMPTDPAAIAAIHAPILGIFGADDPGITPDAVHKFENAMESAGKSIDVKIYDGAGHQFENPNVTAAYRPEAARDAWQRMVDFLAKNLKQ